MVAESLRCCRGCLITIEVAMFAESPLILSWLKNLYGFSHGCRISRDVVMVPEPSRHAAMVA